MRWKMKFFLCLCALATLVAISSAANVFCYFTSWTTYRPKNGKFVPQNVDPNLCTHVSYAFVGLNIDGSLHILDTNEAFILNGIGDLINLKMQNYNLQVLVSMGGWNEGSIVYSSVIGNPIRRSTLVKNIVNFVNEYDFDGFELAWDYPNSRGRVPADVQNLVLFAQELKAALGDDLTLAIAVAGQLSQIDISYDVPKLSKIVDMINVMAYDFHSYKDDFIGHASALYPSSLDISPIQNTLNVNSSINHWISKGVDRSKLNLVIASYGHGFTLADPTNSSLYAPTIGPSVAGPYTQNAGIMGYNEICEFLTMWKTVWDEEEKVPHLVNGNQWIGYEDITSVAAKAQFAKDLSLGGVAMWSLDTDDFNGICGNGKYPLLNKINSTLQH